MRGPKKGAAKAVAKALKDLSPSEKKWVFTSLLTTFKNTSKLSFFLLYVFRSSEAAEEEISNGIVNAIDKGLKDLPPSEEKWVFTYFFSSHYHKKTFVNWADVFAFVLVQVFRSQSGDIKWDSQCNG